MDFIIFVFFGKGVDGTDFFAGFSTGGITMEEYEQVQSMKGTVPAGFTPIGRRASVYTGL